MKLPNILATFLLIGVFSCSSQATDTAFFRAEAESYCHVHSADYWIQSGKLDELNALRPTEKQQALMDEIRSSISSKEMAKIIFEEGGKLPAKEFYPWLQKKIPELTQEPFDCPAIPEFYLAQ